MNSKYFKIIQVWLYITVVVTLLSGMIYTVAQQVYRQTANDPQIQMAEDMAAALGDGRSPESFIPQDKIDMAKSLSPFIVIFDGSGKPIASSALLEGKIPTPPSGVFDYTKQHIQDRLTWQPRPGVRIASVVNYYSGNQTGYVLAGRSLRETEMRIQILGTGILLGWLFILVCALTLVITLEVIKSRLADNRQNTIIE